MKKIAVILVTAAMGFGFIACNKSGKVSIKSDVDSASYATGLSMGHRFAENFKMSREQGQPIDSIEFLKGFKEGLSDTTKFSYFAGAMTGVNMAKGLIKPQELNKDIFVAAFTSAIKGDSANILMTDSLAQVVAQKYQEKMQAKEMEKQFGKNKEAGAAFIEKFKKENANAKTTGSGLVYIVEKEGAGDAPTLSDTVTVNYKGTLVDGKEFDASEEGKPATFGVSQVIKGWTEMLQLMKPGSKVKVVIPYDLAYGERGSYNIEPFSTLVFEVELLGIKKGVAEVK